MITRREALAGIGSAVGILWANPSLALQQMITAGELRIYNADSAVKTDELEQALIKAGDRFSEAGLAFQELKLIEHFEPLGNLDVVVCVLNASLFSQKGEKPPLAGFRIANAPNCQYKDAIVQATGIPYEASLETNTGFIIPDLVMPEQSHQQEKADFLSRLITAVAAKAYAAREVGIYRQGQFIPSPEYFLGDWRTGTRFHPLNQKIMRHYVSTVNSRPEVYNSPAERKKLWEMVNFNQKIDLNDARGCKPF